MPKTSYTIRELAELTGSTLIGSKDHVIEGVSDLSSASEHDASFLSNPRYLADLKESRAGVIFVNEEMRAIEGKNLLITKDPSRAFQKVVDLILGAKTVPSAFCGIHETAIVHPTATLGKNVTIAPYAVIDQKTTIGDNSVIGSHAYVGPGTSIGQDCTIHPRVTIRESCRIGNRCIIQPGAVIGSCGFGFVTDKSGKHEKLCQLGNVVLEDDVEIGSNTTIDRARFQSTIVRRGSKIDNLVMIAHGVEIGEDNLIVGQAGIAGSSKTGKRVILAGQTGVVGHIELGDGVVVAAKSGVSKSIMKAGFYGGIPAMPIVEYNRLSVHFRNLGKYAEQLKKLSDRADS
ncbi:UDP-3-O-(3-hydroxymyristoyl)glucosamine N-acyltransferase [Estrella lausannensis]|uniref:UDP-3-O-acylglucosamine N-acyltransferase n=1 Tax=Estrella lausannensis TaxID=483423 RepID=A0A0H5E7S8_9BACT|nr:UDP-3-O-(3-hydroxymyristoyl)glucosamine N-acyltransferase [Estrella lausannensis]CRX39395.1 UDP-3-O-[3-hydroxymyristoyl] glucosamine N-acyltransferase [Estrella lausannensis]